MHYISQSLRLNFTPSLIPIGIYNVFYKYIPENPHHKRENPAATPKASRHSSAHANLPLSQKIHTHTHTFLSK